MRKALAILAGLLCCSLSWAQQDSLATKKDVHEFKLTSQLWSRGEYRNGAMPAENGKDYAVFISARTLLNLNYKYKGLEVKVAPSFYGVWGADNGGGFGMSEAWFALRSKKGFFAQLGRQKLRYDDQRIIGDDDWAMVISTHDVLRAGYEGEKHKLHFIFAFNQNDENTNGGTYYVNGGQPYKAMETLWYHWDPIPQFGISGLFINTAMQNTSNPAANKTEQQQLFGIYADWHPRNLQFTGSYYRQTGHDEYSLPISAWMTSIDGRWRINDNWSLNSGYYFMSGDENYYVVEEGMIGMARKTSVHGFNPIFGSHHQFYGAMEFFYVSTYYGGNSPGLQDFRIGGEWRPITGLTLDATVHYLATSVDVMDLKSRTLGHEVELEANWQLSKNVILSAGYTYMHGTETMEVLKRKSSDNHMSWTWLMLVVTPEFFSSTR